MCDVFFVVISSSSSATGLSKEQKKRLKLEQKKREKIQRMIIAVMSMWQVYAQKSLYVTRGNDQSLQKSHAKYDLTKYFFTSLSDWVVCAHHTNI